MPTTGRCSRLRDMAFAESSLLAVAFELIHHKSILRPQNEQTFELRANDAAAQDDERSGLEGRVQLFRNFSKLQISEPKSLKTGTRVQNCTPPPTTQRPRQLAAAS